MWIRTGVGIMYTLSTYLPGYEGTYGKGTTCQIHEYVSLYLVGRKRREEKRREEK